MLLWEKKAFVEGASLIIGVDEAGRGPLAGPVVAGAVSLTRMPLKRFNPPRFRERIDDSKKIVPGQRKKSSVEILKKTVFGIGRRGQGFIDRENIHRATALAMKDAVRSLVKKFCQRNNKKEKDIRSRVCVLVDGNIDPGFPYRTVKIIKGDSKSLSIAAASIIAKVSRDKIMLSYDKRFPEYGFSKHKGYGTRLHIEAIKRYGPCELHRKTFAPILWQSQRGRGTAPIKNDLCKN
ncbi:MAG: ribonuclease HII [Candidatus Omnitrophica bacterium]|nr:ribonuclease HII [Candidatus Omnitrophota bacterium]MBU4589720.1 ribonuclease HII [Candidatus Omnitrophota bacterium]